jgi:hypothetical protein
MWVSVVKKGDLPRQGNCDPVSPCLAAQLKSCAVSCKNTGSGVPADPLYKLELWSKWLNHVLKFSADSLKLE